MDKKTYEAPKLSLVGSLEQVTLSKGAGNKTDMTFPDNTPFGNLTFS